MSGLNLVNILAFEVTEFCTIYETNLYQKNIGRFNN